MRVIDECGGFGDGLIQPRLIGDQFNTRERSSEVAEQSRAVVADEESNDTAKACGDHDRTENRVAESEPQGLGGVDNWLAHDFGTPYSNINARSAVAPAAALRPLLSNWFSRHRYRCWPRCAPKINSPQVPGRLSL